jgi:hypothetical protein
VGKPFAADGSRRAKPAFAGLAALSAGYSRVNPWFPRVPPPSRWGNRSPQIGSRRAKPAFAGLAALSAGWLMLGIAGGATAPVAPELRTVVPKIKAKTSVPVLLPSYFPYSRAQGQKLRTAISATRSTWGISLFYGANCGGGNACTIGSIDARRGGSPAPFVTRLRLANGVAATYKPTTCGASCSPAEIDFKTGGVVYRYQLQVSAKGKTGEKAAMIKMANSAIAGGPR